MKIEKFFARTILNSQGHKAVECSVTLDNGAKGRFAPPAGTSVGKYEAKTVDAEVAVEQIDKIASEIVKLSTINQATLDEFLNSHTELGANTTLAISIAFAIAADTLGLNQSIKGPSFYKPQLMVLFFEGGVHSASKVGIQEFMVVYEDIFRAAEDFNKLRHLLIQEGHFVNSGMEGGMVSEKLNDTQIFRLMKEKQLALDIGGAYFSADITPGDLLRKTPGVTRSGSPGVYSIEDPFSEDDEDSWRKFYNRWHEKILIVGDDLTVTNKERIKEFANNAINAVIIKPNQQRTLTDTLEAVQTARNEGLKIIVSHRSGETNQTFVSDLAVAIEADYVKFGAPVRGERVAKYNRLLELTP